MNNVTFHADVKFHGEMPFTMVDVCFPDREQLEAFIAGLKSLLDPSSRRVCLYLADAASYLPDAEPPEVDSLPTEVCFHPPGYQRDEIELRCLASARSHLESLLAEED